MGKQVVPVEIWRVARNPCLWWSLFCSPSMLLHLHDRLSKTCWQVRKETDPYILHLDLSDHRLPVPFYLHQLEGGWELQKWGYRLNQTWRLLSVLEQFRNHYQGLHVADVIQAQEEPPFHHWDGQEHLWREAYRPQCCQHSEKNPQVASHAYHPGHLHRLRSALWPLVQDGGRPARRCRLN